MEEKPDFYVQINLVHHVSDTWDVAHACSALAQLQRQNGQYGCDLEGFTQGLGQAHC